MFIPILEFVISHIDILYDKKTYLKTKHTTDFVKTLLQYYSELLEMTWQTGSRFYTNSHIPEYKKLSPTLVKKLVYILGRIDDKKNREWLNMLPKNDNYRLSVEPYMADYKNAISVGQIQSKFKKEIVKIHRKMQRNKSVMHWAQKWTIGNNMKAYPLIYSIKRIPALID
jgi:hypothetical protein